ncbi:MAG TPA: hypothetical protein VN765_10600 [Candidatus Acidoferrum sp.]|nr:hypothetical protein [Candidatus Acidoferrum sp.]
MLEQNGKTPSRRHRQARFLQVAFTCCTVAAASTSAATIDTNDYFSSLKQFLNTNLDQYEMTYSITHHSNPTMVAIANQLAASGMRTTLDSPLFYRVRLASDGFFCHRALSLANIQNRTVEGMTESITGFHANTVWTSHMGTLDLDKAQALEKSARDGPDWWKRSPHVLASKVLQLGLRTKLGTLEWNGTDFTAVAADFGAISAEYKGKRVISGSLSFASGKPYAFSYTVGTNSTIYRVFLIYQHPIPGGFNIPNQIVIADPIPGNGNGDNLFSIEIISLVATNFPAGSTSPTEFQATGGVEVETSTNGVHTVTGFNGKPMPPHVIRGGNAPAAQQPHAVDGMKPGVPRSIITSSNSFNETKPDIR